MVMKFGYWKPRALGEPIKMLLEYLEEPYEWKYYEPDNIAEWFEQDKYNLGIHFPNLPWMIDGDVKIAQSMAILKYIGRKHGMFGGATNEEITQQETLLETANDLKVKMMALVYSEGDFETKKKVFVENMKKNLYFYEKYFSTHKWLLGDKLFVGDFLLWSGMDGIVCLEPSILADFPNVARYQKEFESIPKIEKYLKSEKFKKFPINGPMGQWGGEYE